MTIAIKITRRFSLCFSIYIRAVVTGGARVFAISRLRRKTSRRLFHGFLWEKNTTFTLSRLDHRRIQRGVVYQVKSRNPRRRKNGFGLGSYPAGKDGKNHRAFFLLAFCETLRIIPRIREKDFVIAPLCRAIYRRIRHSFTERCYLTRSLSTTRYFVVNECTKAARYVVV